MRMTTGRERRRGRGRSGVCARRLAVMAAAVMLLAAIPASVAAAAGKKAVRVRKTPVYVRVAWANLRVGPGLAHRSAARLHKGRRAMVVARQGDWRKVRLATGRTGWVRRDMLGAGSSAAAAARRARLAKAQHRARLAKKKRAVVQRRRQKVVRRALALRGRPYRFGAEGGRGGAFDCSAFTAHVYRKASGAALPRTAAHQYHSARPVPKARLRPADLVFFKNTYKPGVSHVGIYIGGGRFVHASSGAGKVTVDSLRKPYYRRHWAGARRRL